VIIAGAVVIGLIIVNVTPGILGHLFALVVWAAAAWSCVRPAWALTASAARTWSRIGVAVFACLALYAGSLAIAGTGSGATADSGKIALVCYLTITAATVTVYMAIDPNSNGCQTAAFQVQQVTRGGTVSTDSARPFSAGIAAACMGTIDGNPATVVAADGDDGGLCSALGFGPVP
jgi:hypothetical protein